MNTYNQTSDYESYNESYGIRYEDLEVTDINFDGETEITGYVNVDGIDAKMVDIDRDGRFDIGFVDYDGDGIYEDDTLEDISDLDVHVEDFAVDLAIEHPEEAIEFGLEAFLLSDSQGYVNENASIYDFMSADAKVDELEVMMSDLDDISAELDDIIDECDSEYDYEYDCDCDCDCDCEYVDDMML